MIPPGPIRMKLTTHLSLWWGEILCMDLLVGRCDDWNCGDPSAHVGESSVRVRPPPRRRQGILWCVGQKLDETTLKSLPSLDVSVSMFLYRLSQGRRFFCYSYASLLLVEFPLFLNLWDIICNLSSCSQIHLGKEQPSWMAFTPRKIITYFCSLCQL